MCLLVLAWRCHPRYRLVVAANRDEFHARPAAPLAPWDDIAGIVGGRDLQASGAWFAVDGARRFGIVTNFREFGRRRRSAPSRGGLIPAFLARPRPPADYLQALETDAPGYAGFNLLLADRDSLWYASNRADQFARELPPGIYGLSNEFLDTPWPKLVRVRARFAALLQIDRFGRPRGAVRRSLFAMLADRETAPPDEPAGRRPVPRMGAQAVGAVRARSDLWHALLDGTHDFGDDGALRIAERRFDADGAPTGNLNTR